MKYEQTLADVAKAWRNGELDHISDAFKGRRFDVYGLNGGTSIIKAGYPVRITRFSANVNYNKAYQKLINGDLTVTVRYSGTHAYTLEPIPPGRYGRIGGVFYGIVTYSNTSHEYCDESFQSCASGPYKIIAYVGRSNNRSVCVLKPVPTAGGTGGTVTKTTVVSDVEATTGSVVGSIATTTASVLSASASLGTVASGGVSVPTAISAADGVLSITWTPIDIVATNATVDAIASVTPTSATVVTDVATTTTNVVEDIV